MSYIAAFDIGTTNIKGVLVDRNAKLHHELNLPLETLSLSDGYVEQLPSEWYAAVVHMARTWFDSGVDPAMIRCISFSGQMQDMIPIGGDYTPVRPAILYSDSRGGSQAGRILERIGEEEIERVTGNHMDGMLSFPKILWMYEHEPALYEATHRILISSKDYVIARLTGQWVTDPTAAATAGCMNIVDRIWEAAWFEQFGLDAAKMPAIRASDEIVGAVHAEAASETGFAEGTPVLCGIGDAGSATLGAGVYQDGDVYVYLGTSGWMATVSEQFTNVKNGVFNLSYVEAGKFISIAPVTNAGSAYSFAMRTFGEQTFHSEDGSEPYEAFERQIDGVERGGQSRLLFLPYLNGERCPVQDPEASGMFIGLTTASTKSQLAVSVLEGVAYALRQLMNFVVPEPGQSLKRLTLIGGGAKSAVWCQIIADILQCQVIAPSQSQYLPTIGTALLGFGHMGWGQDYRELCDQIMQDQQLTEYVPNEQLASYYEEQYNIYVQLYDRLAPIYRQMR